MMKFERDQIALYLATAAAAATVVSIAAFEVLLGAAIVALLLDWRVLDRKQIRFPPNALPLGVWFALTLLSAYESGDARAAYPQVKKFYVYLMLFVVYSAFRKISQIRFLVVAWITAASLSSAWSLVQFARKYRAAQAAHENFYLSYVGSRITGFMGHWMTFSGHMMVVLLLLAALMFFARERKTPYLFAGALITIGLLAAFTRSMWLGAFVGGMYLIWIWQKRLILALPVVIGLALAANPFALRERAVSAFAPHGDADSNEHRVLTRRVGYRMIAAHPWFGVGPEEVGPHFREYLPADVTTLPTGYYGHLHNIYIHYAAERGIPAMLALMWMIGKALFDFVFAVRRCSLDSPARWVLHAAIAATLAILVSGYYELNLGDSEVLGLFLAVMACGYVAVASGKNNIAATEPRQ